MNGVVVPRRLTDGLTSSTRTKELQATTATMQTTTLAMVALRRWKHPDSGVAKAIERHRRYCKKHREIPSQK